MKNLNKETKIIYGVLFGVLALTVIMTLVGMFDTSKVDHHDRTTITIENVWTQVKDEKGTHTGDAQKDKVILTFEGGKLSSKSIDLKDFTKKDGTKAIFEGIDTDNNGSADLFVKGTEKDGKTTYKLEGTGVKDGIYTVGDKALTWTAIYK